MEDKKVALKQQLLHACLEMQKVVVDNAKKAVDEAHINAIEGDDSTEEKLYNAYREEMQNQRDMFARHYEAALEELATLNKIITMRENKEAIFGAVVVTENANYFLSISLGQIKIDNQTYFAISPLAPLAKAMVGKKAGETFTFRDKTIKILDVF
jgi:transcription elongation GreA/GreB family factor